MEKVSLHLEGELDDFARTGRQIVDYMHAHVKGKGRRAIARDCWRSALGSLVGESFAYAINGPRNSKLHFISEPFRHANESTPELAQRRKAAVKQAEAKMLLERAGDETNG
jgi:hypothetical protein